MSLLEKLSKKKVVTEEVTVDGDKYLITGMSLVGKGDLLASCRKKDGTLHGDKFDRAVLSACVSDADDGSKMTSEQWATVPSHITSPLIATAIKILGFDEDDISRVRRDPKDSGATES